MRSQFITGVQLKLENRFSVALQTIPIQSGIDYHNEIMQCDRFKYQLVEVQKYSEQMRNTSEFSVRSQKTHIHTHWHKNSNSLDFLLKANYWIISVLTSILPQSILTPLTESVHSTMAVSNLHGPSKIVSIAGYPITNLSFWIPNRGSTGIGISILSYGGRLQLGLIADRVAISKPTDARDILQNLVEGIRCMDSHTSI